MAAFAYATLPAIYVAVAVVVLLFTAVLAIRGVPKANTSAGSGGGPSPGEGSVPHRPPSVFAVGVAAGAMTAALSIPGPVLVLYLAAIGVDKTSFRAVSITLLTALFAGAILLQSATVGIPGRVWVTAAALLPLAWAGAALGHAGARRINETMFRRVILVLLAATGSYILITTLVR